MGCAFILELPVSEYGICWAVLECGFEDSVEGTGGGGFVSYYTCAGHFSLAFYFAAYIICDWASFHD